MTRETQPNNKAPSKLIEVHRGNKANFILPPQNDFPDESSSSNSIKKDIKNIIETLCTNPKQDTDKNSSDDTITYDSSLHSEIENIDNKKSQNLNTDKKKNESPKQVTNKIKQQNEEDLLCSTCGQDDSTVSTDQITAHRGYEVNEKYFPPLICKFCQSNSCPSSGLNRTCKTVFTCRENRNDINCHHSRTVKRSASHLSHLYPPNPELFYSDPIYKQHKHSDSCEVRYFNNHNWNQSRYHNSHEYLRPWNHQKAKIQRKYSQLKQQPSGVIGNLLNNASLWYNNLKHGAEGDREELCCNKCPERQLSAESLKLYRAKIEKAEDSDPERIIFNRVTGIPKYHFKASDIHNNPVCQYGKCCDQNTHSCFKDSGNGFPFVDPTQDPVPDGIGGNYRPSPVHPERIDIYYFDHGNSGYYRTTDRPPPLCTEILVERTDEYATKFWAEIFGACHIMVAFITTFFLQLFRFLLYSMVRPLLVGFVQLSSDYFFKPLLTIAFNGFIQPIFILMYNIATSFRDLCEPIAKAFGFFIHEIAHLLKAIRLVDVNTTNKNGPFCYPHQPA